MDEDGPETAAEGYEEAQEADRATAEERGHEIEEIER